MVRPRQGDSVLPMQARRSMYPVDRDSTTRGQYTHPDPVFYGHERPKRQAPPYSSTVAMKSPVPQGTVMTFQKQTLNWSWTAVGAISLLSAVLFTALAVYLVRRARRKRLMHAAVGFEPVDIEDGASQHSFDTTEKLSLDGEGDVSEERLSGARTMLPKSSEEVQNLPSSPKRESKVVKRSASICIRSAGQHAGRSLARPAIRSASISSHRNLARRPSGSQNDTEPLSEPPIAIVRKGRASPTMPGAASLGDLSASPLAFRTTYEPRYDYPQSTGTVALGINRMLKIAGK